MASSSSKISVYSLSDLKNTSDDALPNYLSSLRFQQSHLLTDVRLVLGYLAVAIAAGTFYYDYKFGWEESKQYTLWAVAIYFTLNSALTAWIWGVERGKVFVGSKDGLNISISSNVTKHSPIYKLNIESEEHRGAGIRQKCIEAPFTRWFTADGVFVAKPFQDWLATEIHAIGEAASSSKHRTLSDRK